MEAKRRPDLIGQVPRAALRVVALVISMASAASGQTYIFGRSDFAAGTGPQSAIVADFNGDGKPDLAAVNFVDNTVSIFLGQANGTFGPKSDFATGKSPVSVASDDFNGDGVSAARDVKQLARRFFSPHERNALESLSGIELQAAYFRCWTRKEAYIKAIGEGLSMPLHQFDVSIRPNENANALLATRPDPTEAGRWMVCDVSFHLEYAAAIAVELKAGI